MNMISTGSFLTETGASNKQSELVKKLTAAWEKKNSKTARAGGASLMALSLAACGGEDNTPFSQVDVDAAKAEGVASVDITSDNTDVMLAQADYDAAIEAAKTSNDADITAAAKTEALTSADGTIYATVDAAYTAGSNLSNADAVAAALTGADGVVYASVDAAVTAGADGVDITTDNQAAIDAEMDGTGFASVADLLAAYNTATAATPALTSALATTADILNGTANDDALTATNLTYGASDVLVDGYSADSDTLVVTAADDITATATVAGIEKVTYNLDAATTTLANNSETIAASFQVDVANVTGANEIVLDVTSVGSAVTDGELYNVKSTTVTSDLELTVNAVANADIVINATKATSQTIDAVTGTLDTLTVNGSAATMLTITDADAEESVTVTNTGGVTISGLTGVTTTATTSLDVTAGKAIDITSSNKGTIDATATTGNVTLTDGDAATGNITLTANAGNVIVTTADTTANTVMTLTASGDITNTPATDDGDIQIVSADSVKTLVATATGGIDLDNITSVTTATLSAGQASNLDEATSLSSLTLSNSNAAAATTFTLAGGDGRLLNTINITGDNAVVVSQGYADLALANADTSNSTVAAALIVTDSSSATTDFTITGDIGVGDASLDASGIATDTITLGSTNNMATGDGDNILVASGANVVIGADTTSAVVTAAAVAGNTVTITVKDDQTATDTTAFTVNDLIATNFATVNLVLDDTEAAVRNSGGATTSTDINVSASTDLTIEGAGDGRFEFVAKSVNGSDATGDLTVELINTKVKTITTGSGNDTFIGDGTAAAYVIDGGDGVDSVNLSADYKGVALSLTNIEKIDTAGGASTINGVTGTGQTIVKTGANSLTIIDQTGTGATIDAAGYSVAAGSLAVTGGAGADNLTGSLASATTLTGAGGADTITGGNAADTIVGGDGMDTINLAEASAKTDTVTIALADTGDGDSINDFTNGATNGDVIDFDGTTLTDGAAGAGATTDDTTDDLTTTTHVGNAATHAALTTATSYVYIFDTDIGGTTDFSSLTDAQIVTAVEAALEATTGNVLSGTATSAVTNGAASTNLLLGFTDGSITAIIHYAEGGTAEADFAGELSVIAVLNDNDASTLTHDNFFA